MATFKQVLNRTVASLITVSRRPYNRARQTVVVVRRQSPDWSRIDARYWNDLTEFEQMMGRPQGSIRRLIELWNDAFAVSFFEVRRRMKVITETNFARMKEVQFVDLAQYRQQIDANALYTFVDDDDWFAPELAIHLNQMKTNADGIVWRSVLYAGDHLERRPLDGFCYTNNYAIFGRTLSRHRDLVHKVEQHGWVDTLAKAGVISLHQADVTISVTNKHPCSTVWLERAEPEWRNRGGLRAWVSDLKKRAQQLPDLKTAGVEWARSEIEATRDVVSNL
jgi:hypothetical protein